MGSEASQPTCWGKQGFAALQSKAHPSLLVLAAGMLLFSSSSASKPGSSSGLEPLSWGGGPVFIVTPLEPVPLSLTIASEGRIFITLSLYRNYKNLCQVEGM